MSSDSHGWSPPMDGPEPMDRRTLLTNGLMLLGLGVSYATAFGFGARYLFPTDRSVRQRLLVGLRTDMPQGTAVPFRTPRGQTINVVHGPDGFLALSDVCPHLGCKVHWDSGNAEFICPCHDGHFDADGNPTSGPPADMGVGLGRFDVVEDGDLIFLELEVVT
jgi:cytochrome b6-f complex iron-sulfur subunit